MMTSSKTIEEFYEPYKPIVDALIEKHALEVTVHNLSEVSGFTEAFIVAHVLTSTQRRCLIQQARCWMK